MRCGHRCQRAGPDGARPLLNRLADACGRVRLVWADGGYAGNSSTGRATRCASRCRSSNAATTRPDSWSYDEGADARHPDTDRAAAAARAGAEWAVTARSSFDGDTNRATSSGTIATTASGDDSGSAAGMRSGAPRHQKPGVSKTTSRHVASWRPSSLARPKGTRIQSSHRNLTRRKIQTR